MSESIRTSEFVKMSAIARVSGDTRITTAPRQLRQPRVPKADK
jgi:hypothetical protein